MKSNNTSSYPAEDPSHQKYSPITQAMLNAIIMIEMVPSLPPKPSQPKFS